MKTTEREKAQRLYFQTNHTKTQIAEMLGITRKTLSQWAHHGNWDKLRKSSRTLPAIVAEKCYHLVDYYAGGLLGDPCIAQNINFRHAQTIHLLASSIKKLKTGSTVNETMQTFNQFLGGLEHRHPELAAQVAPEVDEFIRLAAGPTATDHLTSGFAEDGTIPFPSHELLERSKDEQDAEELSRDFEEFLRSREERIDNPAQQEERSEEENLGDSIFSPQLPSTGDVVLQHPGDELPHHSLNLKYDPASGSIEYFGERFPSEEAFIRSAVAGTACISYEDKQMLIDDAIKRDDDRPAEEFIRYFTARLKDEGLIPIEDLMPLSDANREKVRSISEEAMERFKDLLPVASPGRAIDLTH